MHKYGTDADVRESGFMTMADAQARLELSRGHMYRLLRSGRLPSYTMAGRRVFSEQDVAAVLRRRENEALPRPAAPILAAKEPS